MTVGNSARFTTSCRVFACNSATSPVASSARAACSRMDASRSASLGTTNAPRSTSTSASASATLCGPGARKRCPHVRSPATSPANSTGTTWSPNSARSQRTGRLNCSLRLPQRCVLGQGTARTTSASSPGRSPATSREAVRTTAYTYSVPPSSRRSRASTSTPLPRAKPAAALVGLPSASNAILAEGPRNDSSVASVCSGTSRTTMIRRRGVEYVSTSPCGTPAASRAPPMMPARRSVAACRSNAGSSSVPISKARVFVAMSGLLPFLGGRRGGIRRGVPVGGAGGSLSHHVFQIARAARLRDGAHAQDVAHALGGRYHAARVEQVERVAALQHVVVGRKRQPGRQHAVAFGFVAVELAEQGSCVSATSKL